MFKIITNSIIQRHKTNIIDEKEQVKRKVLYRYNLNQVIVFMLDLILLIEFIISLQNYILKLLYSVNLI